jgi:hypothetical protein
MLINKKFELSVKFGLLSGIRQIRYRSAVGELVTLQRSQGGHVLDQEKSHLIAGLVK